MAYAVEECLPGYVCNSKLTLVAGKENKKFINYTCKWKENAKFNYWAIRDQIYDKLKAQAQQ